METIESTQYYVLLKIIYDLLFQTIKEQLHGQLSPVTSSCNQKYRQFMVSDNQEYFCQCVNALVRSGISEPLIYEVLNVLLVIDSSNCT